MAENILTGKDRLKDITDSIEQGIRDLFQSEKYVQYLRTMSRFHRYSVNNTILIAMQKPDATLVAGFNKWRDQFGRNVLRGEKGIKIIAPTPFKKKIEQDKLDPLTKAPMLDVNGKILTEETEVTIPMFKVVSVFDVAQTEGKPLPELASNLTGDVKQYEIFMEALQHSSPVPLAFEAMLPNIDGYFSKSDQRIAIRESMSEVQTVSAAIHEITHAKLHNYDKAHLAAAQADESSGTPKLKDRRTEEVEAESVSYAVCAYFGIATGDNSFGYIASWSKNKELSELRASLEIINKTASSLIDDVDRNFTEIVKERGIDTNAAPEQAAEKSVEDMNVLEMIDHFMSQGMTEDEANDLANSEWQARKTYDQPVSAPIAAEINTPGTDQNGAWRYYIIPDLKTWATNAAVQTDIEYYETLESAISRFNVLRTQPYNSELGDMNPNGEPYARLTLGIDRTDGVSAADILHVRGGQNYLVDDFTRMINLRNNPVVMDVLARVADEIGFDRVKGYERAEGGSYIPAPDIPFEQWNNPYFKDKEPDCPTGIVTREEWESASDLVPVIDAGDAQERLENNFLNNPTDSYAIYQLFYGDEMRDYRFEGMERLHKAGLSVERGNYALVYTGELHYPGDTYEKLNGLYQTFNINHPADFTGHSLSVSDIVALKQNGVVSCHYVDSFGYRELPAFLKPENYLKNAEMAMEDDYEMIDSVINNGKNPAVTEQEQQAKSGKPISLQELAHAKQRERNEKKPSVVEQLKNRPVNQEYIKTAPDKGAEMER